MYGKIGYAVLAVLDCGLDDKRRFDLSMSNVIKAKYWMPFQARRHRAETWDFINSSYSEPHRFYHGWGHIGDLLKKLDRFAALATRADLVTAAIFWHDVVYQTQYPDGRYRPDIDNVRQSAEAFRRCSLYGDRDADAVHALIMATGHHMQAAPDVDYYDGFTGDFDLFLDLDLSGLGGSWARVSRDTQNIRSEFSWVPESVFCTSRAAILRQFVVDDVALYRRAETGAAWSAPARANLLRSIADLEARAAAFPP